MNFRYSEHTRTIYGEHSEKNMKKNTRNARNTRNTTCYALYPLVFFHLKKMNEKIEKFFTNTRKARNTRNAQYLSHSSSIIRHFLLVIFYLFQSWYVSPSLKFCGQPNIYDLFRQFF
jgi:hypothetical protein